MDGFEVEMEAEEVVEATAVLAPVVQEDALAASRAFEAGGSDVVEEEQEPGLVDNNKPLEDDRGLSRESPGLSPCLPAMRGGVEWGEGSVGVEV